MKRMPVEIIWDYGFTAVSPGTQELIDGFEALTYGRNATARDDFRDDLDESIKTFENPEAQPGDKRAAKGARLRGFATMDDRIAEAIQNRKADKRAKQVL